MCVCEESGRCLCLVREILFESRDYIPRLSEFGVCVWGLWYVWGGIWGLSYKMRVGKVMIE